MALPPPPLFSFFSPIILSAEQPCYAAKVPPLDRESRRRKIMRYREKRHKRRLLGKVKCRQELAAKRLRVKGRFVGKAAAKALAGLGNSKNNVSLGSISKAL